MRQISVQKATKPPTAMPTICPVLNEDGSVVAMAFVAAETAAVDPSAASLDPGCLAVQTSQNRSRMSVATPPLPPLPHCVAVGKYRQKV